MIDIVHRVVVTGLGLANALGPDLPTVWRRLLAGENGIAPISFFDATAYSCKVAAEARSLPPLPLETVPEEENDVRSVPRSYCRRSVRLFLKVAREAYADSGLMSSDIENTHVGVASGTSVNYVNMSLLRCDYRFRSGARPSLDMARVAREGGRPKGDFYRRTGDLTSALPAKALRLAGPNLTIDMACAASSFAVGEAFRLIQRGQVLAMVAGGASALVNPIGILAFSLLGALSRNPDPENASCPFDRRRSGFVMGEGAGAVVLERREHAVARGASIYGEVAGFGCTMNAHNLTDPSPDAMCEARAIAMALKEARLNSGAIDYVAAHGTSTPKNDAAETLALKMALGADARRVLVSSHKGQVGHTISAAGVTNLICALKAMTEGCVPPTAHYQSPDANCDLDYVPNESRAVRVRAALANAFAFGGQNAVIAVRAV